MHRKYAMRLYQQKSKFSFRKNDFGVMITVFYMLYVFAEITAKIAQSVDEWASIPQLTIHYTVYSTHPVY